MFDLIVILERTLKFFCMVDDFIWDLNVTLEIKHSLLYSSIWFFSSFKKNARFVWLIILVLNLIIILEGSQFLYNLLSSFGPNHETQISTWAGFGSKFSTPHPLVWSRTEYLGGKISADLAQAQHRPHRPLKVTPLPALICMR